MADFIGEWALKLSANASGMTQVLDGAAAKVGSFASKAKTLAGGAASGIGNAFAAISGLNLGGAMGEISHLGSTVAGVGAAVMTGGIIGGAVAVTAIGGAMLTMAHNTIEGVAQLERFGRRIGLTAQEVSGLQIIAEQQRVSWSYIEEGIGRYAARVGELRQQLDGGGGPMVEALQRMGINAERFASANMGEQLRLLAEGARTLPEGMERITAIGSVIGPRQAAEMAKLLEASPGDFGNLAGIGEEGGFGFTGEQAARMAALSDEIRNTKSMIGRIIGNVGDDLAVVATPAIAMVVASIKALATEGRAIITMLGIGLAIAFAPIGVVVTVVAAAFWGLSKVVGFVMGYIQAGIGRIMPVVNTIVGAIWPVITAIGEAIGSVVKVIADEFAFLGDLFNLWWTGVKTLFIIGAAIIGVVILSAIQAVIFGVAALSTAIARVLEALGRAAAGIAEFTGSAAAGSLARNLAASATSMSGVANSARAASVAIASIDYRNILNPPAASGPTTNQARAGQNQWDRNRVLEAGRLFGAAGREQFFQAMQGVFLSMQVLGGLGDPSAWIARILLGANQLMSAIRSPTDAFDARMRELAAMQRIQGFSAEAYEHGVAQAFGELERTVGQQQDRSPQVALAGSVAEQVAINQAMRQERSQSVSHEERVRRVMERVAENTQRTRESNERVARAVENIRVVGN